MFKSGPASEFVETNFENLAEGLEDSMAIKAKISMVYTSDTRADYELCCKFFSEKYPPGNEHGYVVTYDPKNLEVAICRQVEDWYSQLQKAA